MSEALIEHYRNVHKTEPARYAGLSTLNYANLIGSLCRRSKAKTVLDYGSGLGVQYFLHRVHRLWRVSVSCYDPALEIHEKKPEGQFDVVVCCDVLEHLETAEVSDIIKDIDAHARMFVFAGINLSPAKAKMPDGRNAHTCLKPREWWTKMILDRQGCPWYVGWKTGWNISYDGQVKR